MPVYLIYDTVFIQSSVLSACYMLGPCEWGRLFEVGVFFEFVRLFTLHHFQQVVSLFCYQKMNGDLT